MNEEFKVGDWIYIIAAEDGARGADGYVGQILDPSTPETAGKSRGIKVRIPHTTCGAIWCIGENPNIRFATFEEIPIEYRIKSNDNMDHLIELFKKLNIK